MDRRYHCSSHVPRGFKGWQTLGYLRKWNDWEDISTCVTAADSGSAVLLRAPNVRTSGKPQFVFSFCGGGLKTDSPNSPKSTASNPCPTHSSPPGRSSEPRGRSAPPRGSLRNSPQTGTGSHGTLRKTILLVVSFEESPGHSRIPDFSPLFGKPQTGSFTE